MSCNKIPFNMPHENKYYKVFTKKKKLFLKTYCLNVLHKKNKMKITKMYVYCTNRR